MYRALGNGLLLLQLLLISVPLALTTDEASPAAVMASDDECSVDQEGCALNALQHRGQPASVPKAGLSQEWPAAGDVSLSALNSTASDAGDKDDVVYIDDVPDDLEEQTELQVKADCGHASGSKRCRLRAMCHARRYCVMGNSIVPGGYMIVPGFPMAGMESINGGSAGRYDFLMAAARGRCGGDHCVLMTNPQCCRTQDQFHIHYRHYNGGGAGVKKRLEHALCGTKGWQDFSQCGHAKAAIFDGFPGVFSATARAYGGHGLGNVGVSVWFTKACGGHKTMLLATHCSIEHSVSDTLPKPKGW